MNEEATTATEARDGNCVAFENVRADQLRVGDTVCSRSWKGEPRLDEVTSLNLVGDDVEVRTFNVSGSFETSRGNLVTRLVR